MPRNKNESNEPGELSYDPDTKVSEATGFVGWLLSTNRFLEEVDHRLRVAEAIEESLDEHDYKRLIRCPHISIKDKWDMLNNSRPLGLGWRSIEKLEKELRARTYSPVRIPKAIIRTFRGMGEIDLATKESIEKIVANIKKKNQTEVAVLEE